MRKWQSLRFDWNHARAFLVTAEEGSLSAGAKALGTTQPTLSRQVSALEESMGVILFEKGLRGLELTPNGHALLSHIKEMSEAAGRFAMAVEGQSESLAGTVSIAATELMAVDVLPAILVNLQQKQPEINIELIASDQTSDLIRREADIAVRGYRPTQLDLVAKKVGVEKFGLFASKTYIERFGAPSGPLDVSSHKFIGMDQNNGMVDLLRSIGVTIQRSQCQMVSQNSLTYCSLIRAGAGIGVMHEAVGIADPSVVPVLPELTFPTMDIWLVSHRELRTNKRIRVVYDFLSKAFENN